MKTIAPAYLNDTKDKLILIDQTLLPNEEVFLEIYKMEDIWEAIKLLRVRGAPAIGCAAGFGAYLSVKHSEATTVAELKSDFDRDTEYLATSRPTAVNLFWALNRMKQVFKENIAKLFE